MARYLLLGIQVRVCVNTSNAGNAPAIATHVWVDRLKTVEAATFAELHRAVGDLVGMLEYRHEIMDVTIEGMDQYDPYSPFAAAGGTIVLNGDRWELQVVPL